MEFKVTGRVKDIMPLQSGVSRSGNPWQNKGIRLEIAENVQYPNVIEITFGGLRTNLLDAYIPGDLVEITFAISGREFNGRCYHNLNGIAIERAAQPGEPTQAQPQTPAADVRQAVAPQAPDRSTDMLYAMTGHQAPGSRPLPDGVKSVGQILTEGDPLPF